MLGCRAGCAAALPLHERGLGDCCTFWALALPLPAPSRKRWARWLSLSCLVRSHQSIWTMHPVTVAVCGSRGTTGNIGFELIREIPSDRSWNGQHLFTEWACTCYAVCINHELGSRGIPVATKSQPIQLESCSGSSFWSLWGKAAVPRAQPSQAAVKRARLCAPPCCWFAEWLCIYPVKSIH